MSDEAKEQFIYPTKEERKNGWTAKTLTKYLNERDKETSRMILSSMNKEVRPNCQNHRYSPHRWRS